jgi:hypothetical protein
MPAQQLLLLGLFGSTGAAALASSAGSSRSSSGGGGGEVVWLSHPVRDNETLMMQSYGASHSTRVTLQRWDESSKSWGHAEPSIAPESFSSSGVSVVLPPSSAAGGSAFTAYRVWASTGGPAPPAAATVNVPDIWWVLGDAGKAATNGGGGWVRLFGRSIHLGSRGGRSTLRLTDSGGNATLLPMEEGWSHSGPYCARFRIPAEMAPGLYDVAASNSIAPSYFAPMQPWFESQDQPRAKGQLRIVGPPRKSWLQKVFVVNYRQQKDRPQPTDATPALHRAIAEAFAAGGGVVYLPPGVYNIRGQICLPANTILKGAGNDKTWLTLAKQNMTEAPASGYFTSNMTGGWGVEDLTVYTSSAGYYYSIFNLQKIHSGVSIRRVVLRAQPFHSQVKFCYSGRAHPPEVCNFTWFGGRSPAVLIDGVKNFQIIDNDLYSAWISIGNGHFQTNASCNILHIVLVLHADDEN